MSARNDFIRWVYRHGTTRRLLLEWHALPARKLLLGLSSNKSWSEAGEDQCLRQIAEEVGCLEKGFYVDIGANLPTRRSNTLALYQAGMRGLCVEPNLELAALFEKVRTEDEVICAAVGEEFSVGQLQRFNYHVFSTCSEEIAQERLEGDRETLKTSLLRSSLVAMLPLKELLGKYLSAGGKGRTFFLLKTDTEGFDLNVLRSNDWEKFQPLAILTESTGQEVEIAPFLEQKGYVLAKSFPVNQLFLRSETFEACVKAKLFTPNSSERS